jgi:hypothetical protein
MKIQICCPFYYFISEGGLTQLTGDTQDDSDGEAADHGEAQSRSPSQSQKVSCTFVCLRNHLILKISAVNDVLLTLLKYFV